MRAVSLSQKGTKSDKNEDACLALTSRGTFVVADGVGGGPRGDYASRTLVDEIYQQCSSQQPVDATGHVLLRAIETANQLIYDAAQSPELNGMATTLVCAHLQNRLLTIMHAGDSRAYLLRGDELTPLTADHSRAVRKGENQIKQVVTNAVGIRRQIKIERNVFDWLEGDKLLLLSDGITDIIPDSEICALLCQSGLSSADSVKALVEASNEAGGRDDKTVILAYEQ